MPIVSVILPTCDRPSLWPRALASVLAQTMTDSEVLLVDSNRSTPPLRQHPGISRVLADGRVRLIEEPHRRSAAAARNVGLHAAGGDWVAFLDDDDVYHPEKLAAQLGRARATLADLVLCGYTVVLPRRRRTRQNRVREYRGDALLTEATWGTPFLFCRRIPDLLFDENLVAGEDEMFAHSYLSRKRIEMVPNCDRSLVDVYPQLGAARVHSNMEASWRAASSNWRQNRSRFSREAWRAYLATGRLVRAQAGYGNAAHFLKCAWAVFVIRGPGGWRLVVNATARRLGILQNWVVS